MMDPDAARLRAQIDDIRTLHHRNPNEPDFCNECGFTYPCNTIRTLDVARLDAISPDRLELMNIIGDAIKYPQKGQPAYEPLRAADAVFAWLEKRDA